MVVGIDEVTIILLPEESLLNTLNRRWDDLAWEIVLQAEERLNLCAILGERKLMDKAISGYTIGFSYGDHDFFFEVCYHGIYAKMGVMIKFSAQALAYYQGQTNMFLYEILQQAQSPLYRVRCSRIDIAIDFINEGVSINEIHSDYLNDKLRIMVMRERNGFIEQVRKRYELNSISHGSEFETLMFGKRDSPVMLRIYNKKVEQINKRGSRYIEALQYDDWVRFEAEAKQEYAHGLSDLLLSIKSDNEFKETILGFFIQKFYFMILDDYKYITAPFMKKIIDLKNDRSITLIKSTSHKNTELVKSIIHLLKTSGTITTLYKTAEIWGEEGLEIFTQEISQYLKNYEPNQDCKRFLTNNKEDYRRLYSDFNIFYETEIKPELEDESSS